jgi:excisionase family DNA binding protein
MTDGTDPILTVDEVLGMMRVCRKTLVNGVREGRDLPPHFRLGRKILFRRSAVQAWIEAQEAAAKTAVVAAAQEPGPARMSRRIRLELFTHSDVDRRSPDAP